MISVIDLAPHELDCLATNTLISRIQHPLSSISIINTVHTVFSNVKSCSWWMEYVYMIPLITLFYQVFMYCFLPHVHFGLSDIHHQSYNIQCTSSLLSHMSTTVSPAIFASLTVTGKKSQAWIGCRCELSPQWLPFTCLI